MIKALGPLATIGLLIGAGAPSVAQDVQLVWTSTPVQARTAQLFRLEVEGPLEADAATGRISRFEGVGFAISERHLLTAKHVTRDDQPRGADNAFAPNANLPKW